MILKILIFSSNLLFFSETKTLLIKTKEKTLSSPKLENTDDNHNDYMADIQIHSVDVGNPVELKCVSPKKFSACFFSKIGEHNYYRFEPKASFHDKRFGCPCDVSFKM